MLWYRDNAQPKKDTADAQTYYRTTPPAILDGSFVRGQQTVADPQNLNKASLDLGLGTSRSI